jgi:hypothetical protein
MTKVRTNERTYGPDFREFLIEHRAAMASIGPLPKEMPVGDFDTQIQTWLRTWNPFFFDIPLASPYKDGAIEKETCDSDFDFGVKKIDGEWIVEKKPTQRKRRFRQLTRWRIPHGLREDLLAWGNRITTEATETLSTLFERYRIPPAEILDELGQCKAHLVVFEEEFAVAARVRSARKRKKDAANLNKAAKILRIWQPIHPFIKRIERYPCADDVASIGKTLLSFGPAQNHRPTKTEIRDCAVKLRSIIQSRARNPLYAYIGELLTAAFPDHWNPAADLREATKKLLKGRKSPRTDPISSSVS